jgi:hypothetical protein
VDGLDLGAVSVVFAEATESSAPLPRGGHRGSIVLVALACAAAIAALALAAPALRARLRREVTS